MGWEELGCYSTYPDGFCGRGPLQITGHSNYAYCDNGGGASYCLCPGISSDPKPVSENTEVGMGTAACVWGILSGHSLSNNADGTQNGLLETACYINAGHSPCGTPNGWESRKSYWRKANSCLGTGVSEGSNVSSIEF